MIELEHVSTERIFDEVKNFKEEDLTSKTIYELFKKYDIQDYQRLKDLLNCKKEEFESISYILKNELYKIELRLKNKNEIDIEPEIFTFSNYQNSNIDIETLKLTDRVNNGNILLYSCPTTRGGTRINKLKTMSIAELKNLSSHLSQYRFDNALCTKSYFGIDTVKRVVDVIKFYEEQVLRQAKETEERDINLFLLNKEAKDEIVELQFNEIIEYLVDNAEQCIWGNLPSSKKLQLLRIIKAGKRENAIEDRKRLVNAISNYTTLSELEQGVVKKRTLNRFIIK